MSQTLLVTGASGQLGQRVLHHLLETLHVPASRIVAATRDPGKLANLAARGIAVRTANFDNPASLSTAFRGVDRLLLISTDALDQPGRRFEQHKAAIAAAEIGGVKHVIYTSMPKPENSPLLIAPDHANTEAALASSRLAGFTILRNHWYFENLFMTLPQVLKSGNWYSAAGDGRIAHIARDDLALAAATVLAGEESGRTTYTISGAEALTTAEIAASVSRVLGRAIQVIDVPPEGLVQGMMGAGIPEPLARIFASFDANTAAGRVAEVTGDFRRITGKEPQRFASWLEVNKAAFGA